MPDKKPMVVIKKITIVAGGGHGGAWKVAFADFMTAMMAFFLVMWLLATQSEPQKKAISEYFSTPSVIEYQFNNYGAELTLEKLFLDLINEPLKVFKSFVTPVDRTPNIMAMGMKKIVMAHMAEQLGRIASKVSVTADSVMFEVPDNQLFDTGTANPNGQFVPTMERVKGVTAGLENSDVVITSLVYDQSVPEGVHQKALNVAEERLDLIQAKIKSSFEKSTVGLTGKSAARFDDRTAREKKGMGGGSIRIEIKQKKVLPDGSRPRPLSNGVFSSGDSAKSSTAVSERENDGGTKEDGYDSLVDRVAKSKREGARKKE